MELPVGSDQPVELWGPIQTTIIHEGGEKYADAYGLGDAVRDALKRFGVTQDRVEAWVGGPCGCEDRVAKLNKLGAWAARLFSGSDPAAAVAELEQIVDDKTSV